MTNLVERREAEVQAGEHGLPEVSPTERVSEVFLHALSSLVLAGGAEDGVRLRHRKRKPRLNGAFPVNSRTSLVAQTGRHARVAVVADEAVA